MSNGQNHASRSTPRVFAVCASFVVLLAFDFVCGGTTQAADKPEAWIEVRSPHFRVVSNASEKQARRVAGQFERFREVLRIALAKRRVDPSSPMLILAVKDESSLKALLPEYWEKKNTFRPAGLFLRSVSKDFVVLRIDAESGDPYHVIYHEYAHSLMALNFRSLPLWASEGLAEFFGNATISEKEAGTGRPSFEQIQLLREKRLLPLAALLTADKDSPYYNESNKTSLFYAQAWALTHLLMIGDQGGRQAQLLKYIALAADGTPSLEAAQQAFGDLKQLEQKLEDYVHQAAFLYLPMKLSELQNEKEYSARAITDAESLAARGDFLMHNQHFLEALAMLEESLRLNPKLGLAHESLGFYYFRQGDRAKAAQFFSTAAQLDPTNFLAHYYFATLSSARLDRANAELVESHLRKAMELSPAFAPAYSALAELFASSGSKLEEALQLATRAVQLEPGVLAFHITLANVLLRMERIEDAAKVSQRAAQTAQTAEDRALLTSFQKEIVRFQEYLAQRKKYEEALAAAQKQQADSAARSEAERKLTDESVRQEEASVSKDKKPAKTPDDKSSNPAPPASVLGKITNVTCSLPAQIEIEITASGKTTILHARNYFKIEFFSVNWKPPEEFQPCQHISGLNVKVTYNAVSGMPYAGEILSIEIRK